jgi:glycosyltransferase involved in cell wall biosynthesis
MSQPEIHEFSLQAGMGLPSRRLVFIGGTEYIAPLRPTDAKKFERLVRLGELHVMGWSCSDRFQTFQEFAAFHLLPRLPAVAIRYPFFFICATAIGLKLLRRDRQTILVAQSPYEGAVAVLIRCLARLQGMRPIVVVEVHGDWEEVPRLFRRLSFPKLSMAVMTWAARAVLRRADVVRVISKFTEEKVRRICPEKPLVRFPTFTDLEVFHDPPPVSENLPGCPFILYAGMLVPSKGVQVLLEAFARVREARPDAQLILIGAGHAEARFRSLVKTLGLDQSVRFVAPIPQAQLAAWMRAAVCLVLPSFSEGLGRVVLEAMACGRPAIGTNVGGIPELIQDGVTGYLVPPGDSVALTHCMLRLLQDPALADAMGARGREGSKALFSEHEYFRGYTEVVSLAQGIAKGQVVSTSGVSVRGAGETPGRVTNG